MLERDRDSRHQVLFIDNDMSKAGSGGVNNKGANQ